MNPRGNLPLQWCASLAALPHAQFPTGLVAVWASPTGYIVRMAQGTNSLKLLLLVCQPSSIRAQYVQSEEKLYNSEGRQNDENDEGGTRTTTTPRGTELYNTDESEDGENDEDATRTTTPTTTTTMTTTKATTASTHAHNENHSCCVV